ncbi:MAG: TIGR03960 family B12-binding radical SAM protein [Clostridiales bacterium]|nr:TIGR03960 family B12-binding radical SAM protein [Clostridiales bacterium]
MADCKGRIRPFLGQVEKPQRYLGDEFNQVKKDWGAVKCRFLFGFPDVYEVGMSHLGMHILYEAVNRRPDMLMERCFSPWKDMESVMTREGIPLYGLESGEPAEAFDCVGFTLQHEMSYTNVLQMLKLARIPYWAEERGEDAPLVIAGGPCAANAEPMAPFLDAIVAGEGEELLPALLEVVAAHNAKGPGRGGRVSLLRDLAAMPGVYVPSMKGQKVRKARLGSIEGAAYPLAPLVPYIEVVHDRMMLEILRGCTRGCRFCQAGMIYRPVRERSKDTLMKQARAIKESTGHREISLTSLSSSDHTCIGDIVREISAEFAGERISISLPSLRANHFSVDLANEIRKVRKTGFTFAPEAGSQRMRDAINKGVEEEALLSTVMKAVSAGWRQIKLYFMIGLPGETMEDVDAIAGLCEKVVRSGNQAIRAAGGKGGLRVSCSVSNFVPKAQTPFQWIGQAGQEELKAKQARLKELMKSRHISYSYHDAFTSMLEAVFARGGRELAPLLAAAANRGCRFDSWTEELRRDVWQSVFAEAGLDMEALAVKTYDLDAALPWDHLDHGVSKGYLRREYEKSLRGETTGDCRYAGCTGCGACAAEADAYDTWAGGRDIETDGRDTETGAAGRQPGKGGNVLFGEAVDQ